MGLVVDISIIVIFLLFVIFSAKKGFMMSLLQLISSLLAIFCAVRLSEILAPYAYQYLFEGKIVESITATISNIDKALPVSSQAATVVDGLPKFILGFSGFLGLNLSELTQSLSPASSTTEAVAQEIADKLVYPVVVEICKIAIVIVLFILLVILFNLIAKQINKLFKKLPIIKVANKILGALLGAIKSLVFIALISAIIYVLADATIISSEKFALAISDSKLLSIINTYNPLLSFFGVN